MAKQKNLVSASSALFPIARKAEWIDPANLGTADAGPVCRCDDSCMYATKHTKHHPQVPHAEWFCTRLGELVGIAAPPCAVIEMPGGDLVFGSRWEGGVLPPATPWWQEVKNGTIPLVNIKAALTRIYAFDHFVYNVDRHPNNFIVRSQRNSHTLLAHDYSRAWIVHGFPLPGPPIAPGENTVTCQRQLQSQLGPYVDPVEARALMEKMKRIPAGRVKDIIESHPSIWIKREMKKAILSWWQNGRMEARAELVAKGIEDGTYL